MRGMGSSGFWFAFHTSRQETLEGPLSCGVSTHTELLPAMVSSLMEKRVSPSRLTVNFTGC